MMKWLKESLKEIELKRREGQKRSIRSSSEEFKILSKIESFIKTGVLKVLYCLNTVPSGLRYSELEELSGLPRSTLLKVIDHLQSFGVITTEEKEVEKPRKEKVPFYVLTEKGQLFTEDFFFVVMSIFKGLFEKGKGERYEKKK